MDVRCERCQAEYVFGDDQVGPAGLRVRCSGCGHVFTLKGKQPGGAPATSPRPGADRPRPLASGKIAGGGASPAREWTLRKPGGEVYPCRDLATLQRWIVERKAARDDELSRRGGPFVALGALPELAPFFAVVDDLDRALAGEAVASDDEGTIPGVAKRPASPDGTAPRARDADAGGPAAPSTPEPHVPRDLSAATDHLEPRPAAGAAPEWNPEPEMAPGPAVMERASAAEPGPGTGEHALPALGASADSEPAWTSARPERGERAGVEMPRPLLTRASGGRRKSTGPLLLLLLVVAAAAGAYLARPAWLGLAPKAPAPPEPQAGAGDGGAAPGAEASPPGRAPGLTPPSPNDRTPPGERAAAPTPSAAAPASSASTEPATTSPGTAAPAPASESGGPAPAGAIPPSGAPPPTAGSSGATAAAPPTTAAASPAPTTSANAPTPAPTPTQAATSPGAAPAKTPAPAAGGDASTVPAGPPVAAAPGGAREDAARSSPAAEDGRRAPAPDAEPEPQESDEAPAEASPPAPAVAPRPPPAKAAAADRAARETGGVKRLLTEGRRLRERGRPDAALRVYARALEADPGSADALAGRGLCYLDLSQYAPAESSFGAALKSEPNHAAALMGLAETYRYEGRRADAVSYYRRYLTAHPDGGDAVAARNAIDALQESP